MLKRQLQKWAARIAKAEGKKSQAKMGDIEEILKIIITMLSKEKFQVVEFGAKDEQSLIEFLVVESGKIQEAEAKKTAAKLMKVRIIIVPETMDQERPQGFGDKEDAKN